MACTRCSVAMARQSSDGNEQRLERCVECFGDLAQKEVAGHVGVITLDQRDAGQAHADGVSQPGDAQPVSPALVLDVRTQMSHRQPHTDVVTTPLIITPMFSTQVGWRETVGPFAVHAHAIQRGRPACRSGG